MVLAFVSAGYFESAPCNRELGYAIEFDRPIVLMREMEPKKGGISLESARSGCPSDLLEAAFAEPHLDWHRMKEFQILTLARWRARARDAGRIAMAQRAGRAAWCRCQAGLAIRNLGCPP